MSIIIIINHSINNIISSIVTIINIMIIDIPTQVFVSRLFTPGATATTRGTSESPAPEITTLHHKANKLPESGYTPGPHNKNPCHKTFAKGWFAQKT